MNHGSLPFPDRSLAWQAMAEATRAAIANASGNLALPHCPACGHLFYPPQSYCPRCLHGSIGHQADSGTAVVISTTRLHTTLDPVFAQRLPLHVAAVRTDSGVTLFALCGAMLPAGTRVTVCLAGDDDGPAGLLHARSIRAGHDENDKNESDNGDDA